MHVNPDKPSNLNHSSSSTQKPKLLTKWQKAAQVAKQIFFGIVTVALLFYQAPMLVIGFVVGITLKDHMRQMIENIKGIWKRHPYLVFGAGFVASVFAFSAVILCGAFFTGGVLGVKLMEAHPIHFTCCSKRKA